MSIVSLSLPQDYWKNLSISKPDIDFINTHLFEHEMPLTEKELAPVFTAERIRCERASLLKKHQADGKTYLPKEHYKTGEKIVFPALGWSKGEVVGLRAGVNPEIGDFEVIEVGFEDGSKRMFAAKLGEHGLNQPVEISTSDELLNLENVLTLYGAELERKLTTALNADTSLVRIAGRWFPRALLVDVNIGHLNLAEAVLDEAQGQPLPTSALIEQIELPLNVNPRLVEFSMNLALQEDGRFEEVGPAGEVLWCLRRLEPEDVQNIPLPLRYIPVEYDRSILTSGMLAFEKSMDDELSEIESSENTPDEVTINLTYPHWRAGTLPVSTRVRGLFPTAYESPRVRFTLVDKLTNEEMPAWVVRRHSYVSGLQEWYHKHGLIPGSLVVIRKGREPGKVFIQAKTRRSTRDWVRTVLVGSDGGIVFAMLRQNILVEYDERMVVFVPDVNGVDQACAQLAKSRMTFEQLVITVARETTKLNLQGHVHVQELYSALNIIRRCPPAPMLWLLASHPGFSHVGDLYYRISGNE